VTPSAIKPATLPCVVQCLNQLGQCVPQNHDVHPRNKFSFAGTNCLTQEVGNYTMHDHQMQTCLSRQLNAVKSSCKFHIEFSLNTMKFMCSSRSISHLTKPVLLLVAQKTINSMGPKPIFRSINIWLGPAVHCLAKHKLKLLHL